jgi:ORF6N domain
MAKKSHKHKSLIPSERIERSIMLIRGQKVLLDSDLAELYDVETKVLNQAVKRNLRRFPADFMFRPGRNETRELNRSQFVTGSQKHRDPRYPPYAFTEQGVAMLSSVLNSDRAVAVNIEIMRAFVRLREMLAGHADLARRLDELEQKYDTRFRAVFDAIRQLMIPPDTPKKGRIGFQTPRDEE